MGFMSLAKLMEKDIAVLLLALLIVSIVNTVYIAFLFSSVKGIKKDIIWRDVYEADQNTIAANLEALKDKIVRLETKSNGRT